MSDDTYPTIYEALLGLASVGDVSILIADETTIPPREQDRRVKLIVSVTNRSGIAFRFRAWETVPLDEVKNDAHLRILLNTLWDRVNAAGA